MKISSLLKVIPLLCLSSIVSAAGNQNSNPTQEILVPSSVSSELPSILAMLPTVLVEKNGEETKSGIPGFIPELKKNSAVQEYFYSTQAADGGTLLGVRINSSDAVKMRLGMLIEHIPATVTVAFFSAGSDTAVAPPVTGGQIQKLINSNRADGDLSDNGHTYWSPMVESGDVVVLLHLPANINPKAVRLAIPWVRYLR
jgi:hypothetical protein